MLKHKAKTTIKEILYKFRYIFIVSFISIFALLYQYYPINEKASKAFYIDASSYQTVIKSLEINGFNLTFIDKAMVYFSTPTKSAWYEVGNKSFNRYHFFRNLSEKPAKTMTVVIYSAETYREIAKRLANDLKIDKSKLIENYEKLTKFKEADIIAGHYRLARDANEQSAMAFLFYISQKRVKLFSKRVFKTTPSYEELKKVIIIASIIQKESNGVSEMPLISSVIHNRLKKKMRLQMDSTLNYGKYSRVVITPERIKNDTSAYNTYKHAGLPPHPIASISHNALEAAVYPRKSDYLFFMLKPNGKHAFSSNYKDHLANIRVFREYQKKRATLRKKEELAAKKAVEEKKRIKAKKEANKKALEIKMALEKKKDLASKKELKAKKARETKKARKAKKEAAKKVALDANLTTKEPKKIKESNSSIVKDLKVKETNATRVKVDENKTDVSISPIDDNRSKNI